MLEVEALHGQELQSWQVAHHPVEQLFHPCAQRFRIGTTRLLHKVVERHLSQVILQVAHLVVARSQDLRHRQAQVHHMPAQCQEGVVLLRVLTDHADHSPAVGREAMVQPVIMSIAGGATQHLHSGRLLVKI